MELKFTYGNEFLCNADNLCDSGPGEASDGLYGFAGVGILSLRSGVSVMNRYSLTISPSLAYASLQLFLSAQTEICRY